MHIFVNTNLCPVFANPRMHTSGNICHSLNLIFGLLILWFCCAPVTADEAVLAASAIHEESARIYRSPEERRDAGLGRKLTRWLKVSGLAELETAYARNHFAGGRDRADSERPALALQLGLEMTHDDWLAAELIYDFETNGKRKLFELDEAVISADLEPWGLKAGRQFLPFGEYYSHFVSGPVLEFGETRANSLVIDYSLNNQIEFSTYILDGDSRRHGSSGFYSDWDWGVNLELVSVNEATRLNIGYLTDLSESEEGLLADSGNAYLQRVPVWNASILLGFDSFELTAEVVRATREFREFDKSTDSPFAWNLELAYFHQHTVQYAFRLEFSDELEDQPRWQYGVAATWRPFENVSLSMEYLRSHYKKDFVLDNEDNALNSRDQVAAQLSFEF